MPISKIMLKTLEKHVLLVLISKTPVKPPNYVDFVPSEKERIYKDTKNFN